MKWMISFFAAVIILALGGLAAFCLKKPGRGKNGVITAFNVLLCSVFLAGVSIFYPVYSDMFQGEQFQMVKAVLLTIQRTLRLFILDCEIEMIMEHITADAGWVYTAYSACAAVLFVLAPLLTFGMVLSFFRNLFAWRQYLFGFFRDVYIFSELNEKSLALAKSIHSRDSRRLLVFTNVFDEDEEKISVLAEQARDMEAVCFKKDVQAVKFLLHSKKRNLYFFAIGECESENLDQALKLIELYGRIPNTHLFVFSTRVDGELLLTSVDKGKMRVRRVNDIRSLINRILYEDGDKIFANAVHGEDGKKHISAVVVGMGHYGSSMVKALSWFGQMDGYDLTIDVFDRDPMAYDKLYVQCPELISDQYNGVTVPGEACYKIRIHSGMDVDSRAFAEKIGKLNKATYVLISLGADEENIRTAAYLRMLFERNGAKPVIQAIVYNSDKAKALNQITNYRGQTYAIDFIGDLETSYSEDVILNSELEKEALERHLKWGAEDDFWKYEYNYSSSVASAIHIKARKACGMAGSGKGENELTEEECLAVEQLEHRRWNAYMRSEGYVYSGSPDNNSRNDLGKMHNDMVEFHLLSEAEKRKDLV